MGGATRPTAGRRLLADRTGAVGLRSMEEGRDSSFSLGPLLYGVSLAHGMGYPFLKPPASVEVAVA